MGAVILRGKLLFDRWVLTLVAAAFLALAGASGVHAATPAPARPATLKPRPLRNADDASAIPEPRTFLLIGFGLVGLGILGVRRRRA